jgi:hypothetical protein
VIEGRARCVGHGFVKLLVDAEGEVDAASCEGDGKGGEDYENRPAGKS